ncbi:MAG: FtsL-like putative cell division protein [Paludibacter sp.]|nr:FtsL-like putative cell division protein [Paludibacter sp.]
MVNFKEILKEIKGNEDFSDLKSSTVRDFLNGDIFKKNFFKKQYVLLLLIAFLTFCYIGYHYLCEKQLKQYETKNAQLVDSKYEWLTVFADYTKMSRLSNIRKSIGSELKESKTPAIILEKEKK